MHKMRVAEQKAKAEEEAKKRKEEEEKTQGRRRREVRKSRISFFVCFASCADTCLDDFRVHLCSHFEHSSLFSKAHPICMRTVVERRTYHS